MIKILIMLLQGFINKIRQKKEQEVSVVSYTAPKIKLTLHDLMDRIDFDTMPPIIIENTDRPKTLFILDDIQGSRLMYQTDFNKILRKYGKNVEEDFNIVFATGNKAGYIAYNYITNLKQPIDVALLDITLGGVVKFDDGEYIDIDGVDIAIELFNRNNHVRFVFSTSHTLNREVGDMVYYHDKFVNNTGVDMMRYYLDKNNNNKENDRAAQLYKLLYNNG